MTTKAWTYSSRGLPRQTLTQTATHPIHFPPSPADQTEEWIPIRVAYAALNPGDVVTMALMPVYARSGPSRTSAVPCYDLTGTVLDVWTPSSASSSSSRENESEAGPTRFQQGDEVVAFAVFDFIRKFASGGLQGTVTLPARYAVHIPAGKAPAQAAGLLLTGCTAWQQMLETNLGPGKRVLVNGASGGCGTAAIQMARAVVGPEGFVVGVCSGRNSEMVRGLGADEVVDYTLYEDLPGELASRFGGNPFDVVLDEHGNQALFNYCAGFVKEGGVYDASSVHYEDYSLWSVLRAGMTLLWNGIRPRSTWLGGTGREWKAVSMFTPSVDMMETVARLLGEDKLRVVVDSEWEFGRVLEAYDVLMSGRARGKVIIRVDG